MIGGIPNDIVRLSSLVVLFALSSGVEDKRSKTTSLHPYQDLISRLAFPVGVGGFLLFQPLSIMGPIITASSLLLLRIGAKNINLKDAKANIDIKKLMAGAVSGMLLGGGCAHSVSEAMNETTHTTPENVSSPNQNGSQSIAHSFAHAVKGEVVNHAGEQSILVRSKGRSIALTLG